MAVIDTQLVVGYVGSIYELRHVGKDNTAVVDFTVATTRSRRVDNEWKDDETHWTNVTAWGRLAENIAATWKKGDNVFVYGRIDMKPGYTNKDGVEVPSRPQLVAEAAGHENSRYASEQPRENRGGGNGGQRTQRQAARPAQPQQRRAQQAPVQQKNEFDDMFSDDSGVSDDDMPF